MNKYYIVKKNSETENHSNEYICIQNITDNQIKYHSIEGEIIENTEIEYVINLKEKMSEFLENVLMLPIKKDKEALKLIYKMSEWITKKEPYINKILNETSPTQEVKNQNLEQYYIIKTRKNAYICTCGYAKEQSAFNEKIDNELCYKTLDEKKIYSNKVQQIRSLESVIKEMGIQTPNNIKEKKETQKEIIKYVKIMFNNIPKTQSNTIRSK